MVINLLIQRTLLGDAQAFRELLLELRPHVKKRLRKHYGWLRYAHDDLAAAAEELLFQWLNRARLGKGEAPLRDTDTTWYLSVRLLAQVVRQEERYRARTGKIEDKIDLDIRAEGIEPTMVESSSPELDELTDKVEALPERHRLVLWAEARHQFGEGPPGDEQLRIDGAVYRQRLKRARVALARRLGDPSPRPSPLAGERGTTPKLSKEDSNG